MLTPLSLATYNRPNGPAAMACGAAGIRAAWFTIARVAVSNTKIVTAGVAPPPAARYRRPPSGDTLISASYWPWRPPALYWVVRSTAPVAVSISARKPRPTSAT